MFESIKKLLIKEQKFPCIVWDGKTMSYPHLTKKQLDNINTSPEYKDWIVTLKKEQ